MTQVLPSNRHVVAFVYEGKEGDDAEVSATTDNFTKNIPPSQRVGDNVINMLSEHDGRNEDEELSGDDLRLIAKLAAYKTQGDSEGDGEGELEGEGLQNRLLSLLAQLPDEDEDDDEEYADQKLESKNVVCVELSTTNNNNNKDKCYQCHVCKLPFNDMANLKRHVALHTKHSCPHCSKSFVKREGLQKHLLTHMSKENQSHLHSHQDMHRGETLLTQFQCSKCMKCFPRQSELSRHMLAHVLEVQAVGSIDQPSEPHQCTLCEKNFEHLFQLQSHSVTHTTTMGNDENTKDKSTSLRCVTCNREFGSAGALRSHMVEFHAKVKPFKCDDCGRSFSQCGHLKRHVEIKHKGRFTLVNITFFLIHKVHEPFKHDLQIL